jgi:hypothetical protein
MADTSDFYAMDAGSTSDSTPTASTDPDSNGTDYVNTAVPISSSSEGNPVLSTTNSIDVLYQDFQLYVEGVQLPFNSISISQNMGELPSALISVPPASMLMDIARGYQPKVHIFYTDYNTGGQRLLFWGHIVAVNYARSVAAHGATSSITFQCLHKNALAEQVQLEFANYIANLQTDTNPLDATAVTTVPDINSSDAILRALKGISGMQTNAQDLLAASNTQITQADVSKLSQRFVDIQKRYIGMPAAIMNFWNQIKKAVYSMPYINAIMQYIYIPLMEDGIGYFDRIAGHDLIESIIDQSKQPYCPCEGQGDTDPTNTIMVPPFARLPNISAVQTTLAHQAIAQGLNLSGEKMSFGELFRVFYRSCEYEVITMASPASVPPDPASTVQSGGDQMAIETVVKPQTPFYYAPVCNVLFPHMYHTINITQQEDNVPSRITVHNDVLAANGGTQSLGLNYPAPPSIRDSIVKGIQAMNNASTAANGAPTILADLNHTTAMNYNVPGKYETGRGVHSIKMAMPQWLTYFSAGQASTSADSDQEWPAMGTTDYQSMLNMSVDWKARYGYRVTQDNGQFSLVLNPNWELLDPYSKQSNIQAYQRLLFAAADYEYAKRVAASRSGYVDGIFNPYIIPGYPMDVIDDSPNNPCFHATCSSVTHTITSSSVSTTVGLVAAMTYSEMSNYYFPPVHPWLQNALQIINVTWGATSTQYGDTSGATAVRDVLINNPTAKAAADTFYQSVLGVGSADPSIMFDFTNGQPTPVGRYGATFGQGSTTPLPVAGGDANDYNTSVGNLRLVARNIEGRQALQDKFGIGFIDLTPAVYSPVGTPYQNPILSENFLLEPGASMFIDYEEIDDFMQNSKSQNSSNTSST